MASKAGPPRPGGNRFRPSQLVSQSVSQSLYQSWGRCRLKALPCRTICAHHLRAAVSDRRRLQDSSATEARISPLPASTVADSPAPSSFAAPVPATASGNDQPPADSNPHGRVDADHRGRRPDRNSVMLGAWRMASYDKFLEDLFTTAPVDQHAASNRKGATVGPALP